eukprot:TRINITY_DN6956_c0_g1_i1.p1 TRINITY_DN6956_c0_g1~~TRINITY_DN6956_c0_g1_i1.p1  ORF type:complete len:283 (+),score=63.13 TRINITY_DN6956_c0_g1_i1:84-932(+)
MNPQTTYQQPTTTYIPASQPQKKSFKDNLTTKFNQFSQDAERAFREVGSKIDRMRTNESEEVRWRQLFSLPEQLLADFPCKLLLNNQLMYGILYVSYHHIGFYSGSPSSKVPPTKFLLPFSTISSMQKGATLDSKSNLPTIVPLAGYPEARPKVIQFYTDRLIHTFIFRGSLFDRVWNTIEHAMKASPAFGPTMTPIPPPTYTEVPVTRSPMIGKYGTASVPTTAAYAPAFDPGTPKTQFVSVPAATPYYPTYTSTFDGSAPHTAPGHNSVDLNGAPPTHTF